MTSDVVAIEQVLHRYCHAVDRGTLDDVMEVFHRDAVLRPRYEGEESHSGAEAVRAWYASYLERVRGGTGLLRHMVSTADIRVEGEEARSVCYLSSCAVGRDGRTYLSVGRYEDRLVKEAGRWWIADRAILVDHSYSPGA